MERLWRVVLLACFLVGFLFAAYANAADVTLALNPNSTTEPAGYKLYWGTTAGTYTVSIDLGPRGRDLPFTITLELKHGTIYYFAATAYIVDSPGGQKFESGFSSEVSKRVNMTPPKINELVIK